jgi:hypothetical protein
MTLPRELGPIRHDLERAGVTYRKLDHWTALGLIWAQTQHPGSGVARSWTAWELRVAVDIGKLTKAGIELRAAARFARGDRFLLALLTDLAGTYPTEPQEATHG